MTLRSELIKANMIHFRRTYFYITIIIGILLLNMVSQTTHAQIKHVVTLELSDVKDCDVVLDTEVDLLDPLEIYPNPVKEQLNITSQIPIQKIIVRGMQGNTYLERNVNARQYTLPLTNISAGIVFITVIANNRVYIRKVVKHD